MFKLQVQDDENDANVWHDVKDPDGKVLLFKDRDEARARLEAMFPVLVKMEQFQADAKRTRVVAILDDKADAAWTGDTDS